MNEADKLLEAPEYTPYSGRGEYTRNVPSPGYYGPGRKLSFYAHASAMNRPSFIFRSDKEISGEEQIKAERERLMGKLDKEISRQQQTRPLGRTQTIVAPTKLTSRIRAALAGRNYVYTQGSSAGAWMGPEGTRNTERIRSLVKRQQPGERLYRIVTQGVPAGATHDAAALYFNATPDDFETIKLDLERIHRQQAAARLTGRPVSPADAPALEADPEEAASVTFVSPVTIARSRSALEPHDYVETLPREPNSEAVAGLAGLRQPGQQMYRVVSRLNKDLLKDATALYFNATPEEAQAVKQRLQGLAKRQESVDALLEAPEMMFWAPEEPDVVPELTYTSPEISITREGDLKQISVSRRPAHPASSYYSTSGSIRRARVVPSGTTDEQVQAVVDELTKKVDKAVEKELTRARRIGHLAKPDTLVAPTNLTAAVRDVVEPHEYVYCANAAYYGPDAVASLSRRIKPGEQIYRVIGSNQSPTMTGTAAIYFIATPEGAQAVDAGLRRLTRARAANKMQECA